MVALELTLIGASNEDTKQWDRETKLIMLLNIDWVTREIETIIIPHKLTTHIDQYQLVMTLLTYEQERLINKLIKWQT